MGVVISSDLVLSQQTVGEQPNANNPLIGWRSLVTVGNIVADSEDPAFPALNLANTMTHLHWRSTSTAEQYITVTTNEVEPIDYVGIAGHNFGSAQIPVSIEGDDGGGFTELVQATIPANDAPLLFRWPPQSLQAVRIRMQPGIAAPLAAVAYVGKLLVLQRRIYVGHRPLSFAERVDNVIGVSDRGQFLGNIVLSAWVEGQIQQSNVTPEFYRAEVEPWRRGNIIPRSTFFFAWRPGDYPAEVTYCWPNGDLQASNQHPNGMMQFSLNVQGIVS